MLRTIDLIFSVVGLCLLLPILIILFIIAYLDTRSPLFVQSRLGLEKRPFNLLKFRTMRLGTASLPSHEVGKDAITTFGSFLRKTKLDELPQLWNVVAGDMSLVGPRPCLPSQTELIGVRDRLGIFKIRPGITGLAQIRGVDMATPILLGELERSMIESMTVGNYFKYLLLTVVGRGSGDAANK